MPRKTHALKNAAKAEEFQRTLGRRLHELRIPKEQPVRVWVSDEHRYGLIPTVRRSWGLRRVRTYARQRTRYQWSYTASALEVGGEHQAVVCIIPEVHTEWSLAFLEQIAAQDPKSTHIVLWDGAGFHPKDGACLRRALSNRLPEDLQSLDRQAIEALRHLWEDPACVASMAGSPFTSTLSLHSHSPAFKLTWYKWLRRLAAWIVG